MAMKEGKVFNLLFIFLKNQTNIFHIIWKQKFLFQLVLIFVGEAWAKERKMKMAMKRRKMVRFQVFNGTATP